MSNKHIRFLKVAHEMALKTQNMRRGFGCVIVNNNKIIATGRNYKSHPKVPQNVVAYNQFGEMKYFGLHCEVAALLKCSFNVKGFIVYIHGQNVKTGNLVNSEPCQLCRKVLRERGIKQAIYTTKIGYSIMDLTNQGN